MSRAIAAGAAIISLAFSACLKQKVDDMSSEKNINYPAAFVVNGEDGQSVSVISVTGLPMSRTSRLPAYR